MTGQRLVVFTDDTVHPCAAALLVPEYRVLVLPAYCSEDSIVEAVGSAAAILARLGRVSRRVIESAPSLKIVARHGVGVDSVDVEAATKHGVIVTTSGPANAAAVAEYTFALLFAAVRRIPIMVDAMRNGGWKRESLVGLELDGKTFGVVGLGAIGARVARQATSFGMRVLAYDPCVSACAETGVSLVPFAQLLADADIVSLHLRLTASSANLIGGEEIRAMKPGVVIVNTARGEVIDESALIAGLRSGHIGAAALDTFATEPLPTESPLRTFPNVILSPHVAGQTLEAMYKMATVAAQCILDELHGHRPQYVYNPAAYQQREP